MFVSQDGTVETVSSHKAEAESITGGLRDLQKCRELSNYISYSHRLESIGIDDSIAWLRWVYPDNPPAIAQQYLERLLAGDATAEADILQVRTEVGL